MFSAFKCYCIFFLGFHLKILFVSTFSIYSFQDFAELLFLNVWNVYMCCGRSITSHVFKIENIHYINVATIK